MLTIPNWKDMPPELLFKIFQSCNGTDGMRGVCHYWKSGLEAVSIKLKIWGPALPLAGLGPRFQSLVSINLQHCTTPISPTTINNLHSLLLTSLALTLGSADFTEQNVGALRGLSLAKPSLTLDLQLGGYLEDHIGKGLGMLQGLPLTGLQAVGVVGADGGLEALRGMPLSHLGLTGELPEGDEYKFPQLLLGMPLTSLNLVEFKTLKDDSLLEALRGKRLETLILGVHPKFTDAGMENLRGMPLTDLCIYSNDGNCDITDAGLQVLRGMPLQVLALTFMLGITGSGLEALRGNTTLISLNLGCTSVDDDALQHIKDLPLTYLDLKETNISDAGLEVFRGNTTLTELNLQACMDITGDGLVALLDVPLKRLNIDELCESLDPWKLARFFEARWHAEVQRRE